MWRSLAIRAAIFVGVLAVLAPVGAAIYFYSSFHRAGPSAEEKIVLFERGQSVQSIARTLKEDGVIRSPFVFRLGAMATGRQDKLKAGEYVIPAEASMDDIVKIFHDGKSILHKITFPEGLTTKQILAIVFANPVLVGDITIEPREGALLPETYLFTRGETRDGVLGQMTAAHDEAMARHWPERADDLPFDTQEQAVILASIVEKETALAAERPRVAAVFVNRLRRGMRLEADSTIIYGLTGGEALGRGLRRSELKKETPYNTYVVTGLPPTPIANPGEDSIRAVLNPADTKELYFVADGTGGHVFAETYDQHRKNVTEWRRIERALKEQADAAPQ